ncbi:hypothetical protein DFH08DRAFT_855389 [Mycena albidolilacea]|uniref:Protein kinase domain-containing protein n=1 Tax=Mycena albidolilacea TaxID=1033008 RepID=A0AAD7AC72_9AGAR|nr:hypothetical protein DFH08DRAFT_855389 [Mycena albidolilacea]
MFSMIGSSRSQYSGLIDAVRVSDNANVILKLINKTHHPHEADIANFLTGLGPNPRNHCVPILAKPDDNSIMIIVVPLLRRYGSPRFDTIGEAAESFRQIFDWKQGLQSIHHIMLPIVTATP